jgi:hypothetical protein
MGLQRGKWVYMCTDLYSEVAEMVLSFLTHTASRLAVGNTALHPPPLVLSKGHRIRVTLISNWPAHLPALCPLHHIDSQAVASCLRSIL